MVLKQDVSRAESCLVVHLLEAAVNLVPYGVLCNLGNCELSGCVSADAYNLILIFASYYYAPWPWPCIYCV